MVGRGLLFFSREYINILICQYTCALYASFSHGAQFAMLPLAPPAQLEFHSQASHYGGPQAWAHATSDGAEAAPLLMGRSDAKVPPAPRARSRKPGRTDGTTRDFLRRSLLFRPRGFELTPASQKDLSLAAAWIQGHPKIHVFVAGYCDTLGSEECTHQLAEGRAVVVRSLLLKSGVDSSQISQVKGWETADPVCATATASCQEMNRRVRIFLSRSKAADRPSLH